MKIIVMKTFILFLVFSIPITMCRSQNQTGIERLNLQVDQLMLSVEKQLLQQLNEVKQTLQNMEQKFEILIDEKLLHLETRLVEQLQQSLVGLRNNSLSSSQDEKSDLLKKLQKMSGLQDVMLDKFIIQCNVTVKEFVRKGFVNEFKRALYVFKRTMSMCDHNSAEVSKIRVTEDPQIDGSVTALYTIPMNCLNCSKGGCFPSVSLFGYDPINHVICDKESHGSDWILIQRRIDGFEDFYLDWQNYKEGFGWLDSEYWLGLDAIHELTTTLAPVELLVELVEIRTGVKRYAKYNEFAIGGEDELYRLKTLGDYEGNAGDALTCHKGYNFSTKDKDNDAASNNIAVERQGAWWFGNCSGSHLNGRYYDQRFDNTPLYKYTGMYWGDVHGYDNSIIVSEMLIRPRNVTSK